MKEVILLFICLGLTVSTLVSCQPKTVSNKNNKKFTPGGGYENGGGNGGGGGGTPTPTPTPAPTYGMGIPPYPVDSSQIVFKTCGANQVVWSTKTHLGSGYNHYTTTNTMLKIRIRPRYVGTGTQVKGYYPPYEPHLPNNCNAPFNNSQARVPNKCNFPSTWAPYSSISITADARADGYPEMATVTFINATVDEWSAPMRFHPHNLPNTPGPIEIRFRNPTWQCNNCPGHNPTQVNPYACLSFDLEIVTDNTDDF